MKRYGNLSGNSGVALFEDRPDFIKVQFVVGARVVYVYDHVVPGAHHVATMKALAAKGRGLSSYLSQHVRDQFRRTEIQETPE